MNEFDLIIIGAGPGGYVAAIRAAQLGKSVAVVERSDVGGTCLNRGCVPTKALLHSSSLYRAVAEGERFGIFADGLRYDLDAIHTRKAQVVQQLRGGVEQLFKAHGIALHRGTGMLTAQGTVRVAGEGGEATELAAKNILLATGSAPALPPLEGMGLKNVLTSDDLLEGTPQHFSSIVIIGGGVIGVEFASFYSSLGCEVAIVEMADRLLPMVDREISQNIATLFKRRGVAVHTGSRVLRVTQSDAGPQVHIESKGAEAVLPAECVLVATGRRPITDGLFEPGHEVAMERGLITVNEHFETSRPGVYAVGDVASKIQLAHLASAQGIAAVERMFGEHPTVDLSAIPACIYTEPEIATVGLTEQEAQERGLVVKTAKFLMTANSKTVIEAQDRGFIKLVLDAATEKVLGAHLCCARATDLVSEFTNAVVNGLTREQMLAVMRPHPTFTEAVTEAFESITGTAIHMAPRK